MLRPVELLPIMTNLFFAGSSMENITASVGEDRSLECEATASTDSVDWFLQRHGSSELRFVYDGEVNQDFTDKYTLQRTDSAYKLTIRDLAISDSGTYICSWSEVDETSFLLIVRNKSRATSTTETSVTEQANAAGSHCHILLHRPRMLWFCLCLSVFLAVCPVG